jgi:hypothetical protein
MNQVINMTVMMVGLLAVLQLANAVPLPAHNVVYDRPSTTWTETIPLGNGLLGAAVWGDEKVIKFSLDHTDLCKTPLFHQNPRHDQPIKNHSTRNSP